MNRWMQLRLKGLSVTPVQPSYHFPRMTKTAEVLRAEACKLEVRGLRQDWDIMFELWRKKSILPHTETAGSFWRRRSA